MVKRGIGAIVLAVIAALLLGYLLKDKTRERQEMVDMKLPGVPDINIPTIPSLSETTNKVTESAASIVEETKDKVNNTGSTVIASANGTLKTAKEHVQSASNKAKTAVENVTSTKAANENAKPGFSFRPPNINEQKNIVDNVGTSTQEAQETTNPATTTPAKHDTVVASAPKPAKKAFKPRIEEEPKAKKPIKKKVVTKKKVEKKKIEKKAEKKKIEKKRVVEKEAAPKKVSATKGKYSIQLLATSSQSRANKLASTMNSEGYVAFITQTTSNNKILYRVRVGAYGDRNSAIKAQESMKRRYKKNFSVQNSLVVSK